MRGFVRGGLAGWALLGALAPLPVAGTLLAWIPAARAQDSSPALSFIRQVGREVPGVLAHATTIQQRRERLVPFVTRVVDVDATAQYCLGRFWKHATAEQQQRLQALFLTVLVNEIALWTGDATNPGIPTTVQMQPAVIGPDGTYVPTVVRIGIAPPAHINWVVNMQATPPRILDVTAEGLSLRETLRSDYVSYLNRHDGDIAGLIGVLAQRAHDQAGMATGAAAHLPPAAQ